MVSSPKNGENSVINYSPSCLSKSIRPLFIFGTQIKIFLMKSDTFLSLHWEQRNLFKVQNDRKDHYVIIKVIHVTPVV